MGRAECHSDDTNAIYERVIFTPIVYFAYDLPWRFAEDVLRCEKLPKEFSPMVRSLVAAVI